MENLRFSVGTNLGVRYDLGLGLFANDISFPPFQEAGRPDDWDNVQPRIGFAFRLTDRMVVRGGSGLYYGDTISGDQSSAIGNTQIAQLRYENDGRPDFAANPTNGRPLPTYDEAIPLYCGNNNNAPGCLIRDVREFTAVPEYIELPRTWQTSIGVHRQFGNTMALEIDYVYSKGSFEKDNVDNINLLFDAATGANLDFRVRAKQRIDLPGRAAIDGIVEVFNIFDRPNYEVGIQENQPSQYRRPINAQYRSAQVGFRFTF